MSESSLATPGFGSFGMSKYMENSYLFGYIGMWLPGNVDDWLFTYKCNEENLGYLHIFTGLYWDIRSLIWKPAVSENAAYAETFSLLTVFFFSHAKSLRCLLGWHSMRYIHIQIYIYTYIYIYTHPPVIKHGSLKSTSYRWLSQLQTLEKSPGFPSHGLFVRRAILAPRDLVKKTWSNSAQKVKAFRYIQKHYPLVN